MGGGVEVSETNTENIFRDFYGSTTFIEKSAISREYGFKSKKNTNYNGYPDFFKEVILDNGKRFFVIVEAKATNHQNACEEVLFYAKNNKINIKDDIIAIAVSGQTKEDYKATYYLFHGEKRKEYDLNIYDLISIEELIKTYKSITLKQNYEKIISVSDDINTYFNNNTNCDVADRPFFFSALIIAMNDKSFEIERKQTIKQINEEILRVVNEKLVGKINQNVSKYDAVVRYSFLKNIDVLNRIGNQQQRRGKVKTSKIFNYNIGISKVENYKKFIKRFFEIYGEFNETLRYYDVIGKTYTDFLKYVKAAGGQDIVITPDHIKQFMYNIIGVDADDVILDTCTGSGGFIATGFGKLIEANKEKGRNVEVDSQIFKNITEKQLVAIENSPNMYSLAFSNMILHGDGKSNLYQGDCFDEKFDKIIHDLKPTLGIINPPYNDKAAPFFMKRLLELLEYGGKAIIIAPSNCLVQDAETNRKILSKHTLKVVIKMSGKILISQGINTQPSLYAFEAHKSHNNQDVYFYDFSDDGYYYSAKKEYENDFKERADKAVDEIKHKTLIDGKSYWEKPNEKLDNLQYVCKKEQKITYNDFINTLIDYTIYELNCCKNYDGGDNTSN